MKKKIKTDKVKNINEYKKEKKNKYKKRKNRKVKKVILRFGLIIVCFLIIIINIYYLKKELRQEEIRLDELKAKVDTNSSIREIEEKAKEELNMDYLKKNQIRYIEVEN